MRCKPWSPSWQRRIFAQHDDQNSSFVTQDYPNEPRAAIEQAVSTVLSAIVALEGISSQDQECARDYSIACPSGEKPLWRGGMGVRIRFERKVGLIWVTDGHVLLPRTIGVALRPRLRPWWAHPAAFEVVVQKQWTSVIDSIPRDELARHVVHFLERRRYVPSGEK